jgi:hypothetical protein
MVDSGSHTPTSVERRGKSVSCRPWGGHGGGECQVMERVLERVALLGPINYPCQGLVPQVPWVAGYDPTNGIRLVLSSGIWLGNQVPCTRYGPTTPI